jgi:hypothetical protein
MGETTGPLIQWYVIDDIFGVIVIEPVFGPAQVTAVDVFEYVGGVAKLITALYDAVPLQPPTPVTVTIYIPAFEDVALLITTF